MTWSGGADRWTHSASSLLLHILGAFAASAVVFCGGSGARGTLVGDMIWWIALRIALQKIGLCIWINFVGRMMETVEEVGRAWGIYMPTTRVVFSK